MTERLDKTEVVLERTAQQQEQNTRDIDTLLGAVSTTEASMRSLQRTTVETEQLFNVVRAEANADRAKTKQMWNDGVTQMKADRAQSDERFAKTLTRINAQKEIIQRLLVELIQANRDATKLRDCVDGLEKAS